MKKSIIYIVLILLGFTAGYFTNNPIKPNSTVSENHSHEENETLYTCGMHPQIIEKEPGDCPICGMKLQPIKKNKSSNTKNGKKKILYWRAPMNPNEIYDKPGKSKMGMDLVPVYEQDASGEGVVSIDGAMLQSMNVKTEKIKRSDITQITESYGILKINEKNITYFTSKFDGWIEKLYVNYVGQNIKKGMPIAKVYSPSITSAEQELISVIKHNGTKKEIENATKKLKLYGVPLKEINRILREKKANDFFTLYAEKSGTIIKLNIAEGSRFNGNNELLRIADLSQLWLIADIYDIDLQKIKVGNKIEARFDALNGKTFSSEISFIYPEFSTKTQSAKVRATLDNKSNRLKPGMFSEIKIFGETKQNVLVIPEDAVIRSGKKNIAILSLGNGKFKPVEISLGIYSNGFYEITEGLNENDVIVSSGQFMIDSESKLRAAINLFASENVGKSEEDKKMNMKKEKNSSENKTKIKTSKNGNVLNIVRKGIIDVRAIDKNGDGKVFQDPMDWNVISDKPGRCPLCGMYLKEFTIEQAEENLAKHGHKFLKKNSAVKPGVQK